MLSQLVIANQTNILLPYIRFVSCIARANEVSLFADFERTVALFWSASSRAVINTKIALFTNMNSVLESNVCANGKTNC
jgi:hypothetical protein